MEKERIKRIEFNIKSGDYFGTFAVVLDLLKQTIERDGYKKENNKTLENVVEDLLYLHKHYKIVRKPKK